MPHKFKDRDVRRAIKAVLATGHPLDHVEVDPNTGVITVFVARQAGEAQAEARASADDTPEVIINQL
jgi:hypothetical protein